MNKSETDKKLDPLAKLFAELGGIQYEMNFIKSRLEEAIYEVDTMKADLESFIDEISKETTNDLS